MVNIPQPIPVYSLHSPNSIHTCTLSPWFHIPRFLCKNIFMLQEEDATTTETNTRPPHPPPRDTPSFLAHSVALQGNLADHKQLPKVFDKFYELASESAGPRNWFQRTRTMNEVLGIHNHLQSFRSTKVRTCGSEIMPPTYYSFPRHATE